MDANERTLRRIVKKTHWSGADAGKALLINWINRGTDKPQISDKDIDYIKSTLNYRQREIFNAYKAFYTPLEFITSQYHIFTQELKLQIETISSYLTKIESETNAYYFYLGTPLKLDFETFSNLISRKDFREEKQNSYRIMIKYILERFEAYEALGSAKGIKDAELKEYFEIFDQYAHTPATVRTYKPIEDVQKIVSNFSRIYKTENTQKAVCNYILNELQNLYEFYKIPELHLKNRNGNIKDIDKLIRIFDQHERQKAFFYGKKFKSVYTDTIDITQEKESNKLAKLDIFLNLRSQPNNNNFHTLKVEYSELYTLTKKTLSEKLPEFSKPDEELLTLEIPNKKLLEILNVNELLKKYLYTIEPTNIKEYVMQFKSYSGILTEGNTNRRKNSKLEEKEEYFNSFSYPSKFGAVQIAVDSAYSRLKDDIKLLCNTILVYDFAGELAGVDFSSIFNDVTSLLYAHYNSFVDTYNERIYNLYASCTGDKKTLKANMAFVKDTFKPLEKVDFEKENERLIEAIKKYNNKDMSDLSNASFLNAILNEGTESND